MTRDDKRNELPKRISLKGSFERAAAEMANAPAWEKKLHEQNREIARVTAARDRGEPTPR